MGPIRCTRGWVFLLVSVRETTIFRGAKEGVAWPSWAGVEAEGQAQRLAHAVPRGQQKAPTKIPLSRFAAWLDCSGMHERRHGASGGRPWPFGLGSRRSFTVSRLQSDASSTSEGPRRDLNSHQA